MLDATVRVPDTVVFRAFATETVVLNLKTGRYHAVNPTGGRMLEVLQEVGTVRDALDRLVEEYETSREHLQADLGAFCLKLATQGLIEVQAASPDAAAQ